MLLHLHLYLILRMLIQPNVTNGLLGNKVIQKTHKLFKPIWFHLLLAISTSNLLRYRFLGPETRQLDFHIFHIPLTIFFLSSSNILHINIFLSCNCFYGKMISVSTASESENQKSAPPKVCLLNLKEKFFLNNLSFLSLKK